MSRMKVLKQILLITCISISYLCLFEVYGSDDITEVEVGDNVIIEYRPMLLEKDRNDAETLEDNICMEIEVVDRETNVKADEKAINYVSGNELCWDIGDAVDKKKNNCYSTSIFCSG